MIRAFDQKGNALFTQRDQSGRPRCVKDPNGNVIYYSYWDKSRDGRLKRAYAPTTGRRFMPRQRAGLG